MDKKSIGRLDVPNVTPQISLEELTTDLSAFLHFLSENYDGDKGTDLPSFGDVSFLVESREPLS